MEKQVITEYSYDLFGNKVESSSDGTNKIYRYNDKNQLTSIKSKDGLTDIYYDKNGNGGSVPGHFVFNATARKTFLPGMSYSFEFTLKFFGDFKETELTLGILEFTEIKNVTDPVGGE